MTRPHDSSTPLGRLLAADDDTSIDMGMDVAFVGEFCEGRRVFPARQRRGGGAGELAELRDIGVHHGQGYLLGRPEPLPVL